MLSLQAERKGHTAERSRHAEALSAAGMGAGARGPRRTAAIPGSAGCGAARVVVLLNVGFLVGVLALIADAEDGEEGVEEGAGAAEEAEQEQQEDGEEDADDDAGNGAAAEAAAGGAGVGDAAGGTGGNGRGEGLGGGGGARVGDYDKA